MERCARKTPAATRGHERERQSLFEILRAPARARPADPPRGPHPLPRILGRLRLAIRGRVLVIWGRRGELSSSMESLAPVTVTVCGVSQLAGVKVRVLTFTALSV